MKKLPRMSLLQLIAVLLMLQFSNTYAGLFTIGINGANCQYGSIAIAITAANENDTIYIEAGTYNQLLGIIDKNLTFVPAMPDCNQELTTATPNTVIIDGSGGSSAATGGLVKITNSSRVKFRHMWLRNATAVDNGGIIAVTQASTLTLDDARVTDGFTNGSGGNIYVVGDLVLNRPSVVNLINDASIYRGEATLGDGGAIALFDSTLNISDGNIGVSSNDYSIAANDGGGIYASSSTVNLTSDEAKIIWNQSAHYGGGLYAINSTINITGALINDNQTSLSGGGMYLDNSELIMIYANVKNNETVASNNTTEGGGALFLQTGSFATITNTLFEYNNSTKSGGAIFADVNTNIILQDSSVKNSLADLVGGGVYVMGSVTLNASVLDANSAATGGGLYCLNCNLSIENISKIQNNSAINTGGGLYISALNNSAITNINNSLIYQNSANYGAGLYHAYGAITIADTSFENNDSILEGGAMRFNNSNVSILNSILNENIANQGGAIHVSASSNLNIINTHIKDNLAQISGGGVYVENSELTIGSLIGTAVGECDPMYLLANEYCSEISGNTADDKGGGLYIFSDDGNHSNGISSITKTVFKNNAAPFGGSGIYINAIEHSITTLSNILAYENGTASSNAAVIKAIGDADIEMHSLTLADNFGQPLSITDSDATILLLNSIFHNNTSGPHVSFGVSFTRGCNNSQAISGASQTMGGISSDPLFTTTARGDYRLSALSPSVDACDNGLIQDLDGLYRPEASVGLYDQGAFEFDGLIDNPDLIFANGFEN